jgi:hypothetical protein
MTEESTDFNKKIENEKTEVTLSLKVQEPEKTVHSNNEVLGTKETNHAEVNSKINDVIDSKDVKACEALEVDLLKIEYDELKYDLPSFDGLLEDFDIEKAFEKDTLFLLREIRKVITEKLSAYLQLFETLMNPVSPPMFVFSALRNASQEDRDKVKELYKKLAKYQLRAVKLDTIYKEEDEAGFVKEAFSEWQELKIEVYNLLEKLEAESGDDFESEKRGYLN